MEEELVPLCRDLMDQARARNVTLHLPTDVVIADKVCVGGGQGGRFAVHF